MKIYEKLMKIQTGLKAPKSQVNKFGNYNYRSCEDILEALKPLLAENKCVLVVTDEPLLVGDRYYIKATAQIIDIEDGESVETTALAREDENRKGMDLSQVTGSTSSYARKYALNGLFCIDDNKDSDSTNKHGKEEGTEPPKQTSKTLSDAQIKRAFAIAMSKGFTRDGLQASVKQTYNKPLEELTKAEYDDVCTKLEASKGKGA